MVLALPVNASLYSAVSTNPQSREPQLAACLRNAMHVVRYPSCTVEIAACPGNGPEIRKQLRGFVWVLCCQDRSHRGITLSSDVKVCYHAPPRTRLF